MLVLFAIMLPLFLLCCAVVIDVGYWWVNGKKAQVAADSCALAAARDLPADWDPARTECVFAGQDYALINLPAGGSAEEPKHLSTRVFSPYEGDSSMVEATVRLRVRTFFGRIVGLEWIDLTRRAVAERSEGEGDYAIYSHSPMCPEEPPGGESLIFNGEDYNINGRVHSNGQFQINNKDFWALEGTNVFCGEKINPEDSARFFGPSYEESDETEPRPVNELEGGPPPYPPLAYETWPSWYTRGQYPCTYSGQKIEIDSNLLKITGQPDVVLQPHPDYPGKKKIPDGVYCASELFKIGGDDLAGTAITALAPKIEVGGNNQFFAPYGPRDMLFFAIPNDTATTADDGDGSFFGGGLNCQFPPPQEMTLANGNNNLWKGLIFNPCGLVKINGGNTSSLEGTILAYQVTVNNNGFNMIGKSDFGGDADVALVE